MKILIRNNDQVVIYAQDDIELDTEAHGNNWRDPNFNSNNATVVEATPPAFWCGGEWMYDNGEWVVIDSQKYAQRIEQARLDTVPSQVTMRQARLALLGAGKLTQVPNLSTPNATTCG